MLELKNISKSYQTGTFNQKALDDVSVKFRKKEFVAIIGTSGSGKTTLLNVIGGLDRYDAGDLLINGKSTKDFRDRDWDSYRNNSVGFIFQSYNLITHQRVLENVELGLTLSGVKKAEKRRISEEVIERVGLTDHRFKKPNQLSGGQMQRVAIARALANDPDIILADEPTGALDTHTSEVVMDLIKEVAKDKLVIMVTHNPDLAEKYADRIIQVKDGKVISDSSPTDEVEENEGYTLKKTAMSFFTALHLSFRNIATKKWRTLLTAFASSIGIIGIALILSLSNGFQKQIDKFQSDALSDFPVLITPTAMSLSGSDIAKVQKAEEKWKEYPSAKEIYHYSQSEDSVTHQNILTKDYEAYVKKIPKSDISSISISNMVGINVLQERNGKIEKLELTSGLQQGVNNSQSGGAGITSARAASLPSFPTNPDGGANSFLEKNYTLLAGKLPKNPYELMFVVDNKNRVEDDKLKSLGISTKEKSISFEEVMKLNFKWIPNNIYYQETPLGNYVPRAANKTMFENKENKTLKVAGVIRVKKGSQMGILGTGLVYSNELSEKILESSKDSDIVKAQENSKANVMTMQPIEETEKKNLLKYLGGDASPSLIMVFPKDFDAKERVLKYLDKYNEGKQKKDKVLYTDLANMITELSGGIMSAITMVLIAFASISLVVSLIMVAIITYISVLERTKEIGVLRSLGARKKDITRVFNAETFIIGLFSGILGISIAYLLTIPANVLIEQATELKNVAQLNPLHALLLITISVILTLLGGFIPARMASKKDPVSALRIE
ncbi:MAG: ABC transporter ATP-binding protein/permease [Streptococcaceae bacterium]|jgi:putative ABC transport system permease protein|nr:ABC transporter ATP-binding protein/permease [Streptococcaceae bacterium]